GRVQLALNLGGEGRETRGQSLRVVGRELLRLRDGALEARARFGEAGLEVSLDRGPVLHRRRTGGLHVSDHRLRALLRVLEKRDGLLLDRLRVRARAVVGAQLLASGLEVVLPGLERAAARRRPRLWLRAGRARAAASSPAAA